MSAGGKEPFYKKMNFIKSSGNGMVLSVDHCTERKNIEYKPLFGNRRSKTHWLIFMKESEED